MKKVVNIMALGILIVSCQKTHHCTCSGELNGQIVNETLKFRMKKQEAKEHCKELDEKNSETYTLLGGNIKCELN